MKTITSVTVFQDAVGLRMSATYSEIDDQTGRILSDNNRYDRVITDNSIKTDANALLSYASESIPQ